MGQKVNPISFRTIVKNDWRSVWCTSRKSYPDLLYSDYLVRQFVTGNFSNAKISDIKIEHKISEMIVSIHTSRPGLLLSKDAEDLKKIQSFVQRFSRGKKIDIKIVDIKEPDMDANLVASGIVKQLERRSPFRRLMKKAIASSMRCTNVKGIRVSCSGRLAGAEIARTEWYMEGNVPLNTLRSDISYASVSAHTTYGVIGVKVWINRFVRVSKLKIGDR